VTIKTKAFICLVILLAQEDYISEEH